jgi:hypothetical protein
MNLVGVRTAGWDSPFFAVSQEPPSLASHDGKMVINVFYTNIYQRANGGILFSYIQYELTIFVYMQHLSDNTYRAEQQRSSRCAEDNRRPPERACNSR